MNTNRTTLAIKIINQQVRFNQGLCTQFNLHHSKPCKKQPPNINTNMPNCPLISLNRHNIPYTLTYKYRLRNPSTPIIIRQTIRHTVHKRTKEEKSFDETVSKNRVDKKMGA
ncbi:hypothetical protein LXL04_005394 [Taraxacum kok-saghyz]